MKGGLPLSKDLLRLPNSDMTTMIQHENENRWKPWIHALPPLPHSFAHEGRGEASNMDRHKPQFVHKSVHGLFTKTTANIFQALSTKS